MNILVIKNGNWCCHAAAFAYALSCRSLGVGDDKRMIAIGESSLACAASAWSWKRSQQMKVHPAKSSLLQVKKTDPASASRDTGDGCGRNPELHSGAAVTRIQDPSVSPSRFLAVFSGI
jgi:hypothetical protein